MGQRIRWLGLIVGLGLVLLIVWRYPTRVTLVNVSRGPVVDEVLGTGTFEARVAATISPKTSGRIALVVVDQGQVVKQGELLVQLEDDELQQQVAIADANVEAAKASIERLHADKSRAVAVMEQAERHHARILALNERNVATAEDLERAAESLAVATSDVARAEAANTEGQRLLVAAERTREYHAARLNDTRIVAPFDGMIVARQRESGDIAVPGSAILTLISLQELWINAWVDESEMARLAVDQPARVVFRSQPAQSLPGRVARLGKQSDRETREFIVDVRVEELPAQWAVGQRAEVYIQIAARPNVVKVPSQALVHRSDQAGVFLDIGGVARWRPVKIGVIGRDEIEIMEGLAESDRLIVPADARQTLRDGKRVSST